MEYPSIKEDSNDWNNSYKKIKKWCVTEKIHGANFSFVYDCIIENMKYAKRTEILKEDDAFFGYKDILESIEPKIMIIIQKIKKNIEDVIQIIIYGELFGGIYPNYEQKRMPIQKGIYYSPNINFYAFDIYIIERKPDGLKKYFVDFEKSIEYFEQANILYAEPLEIFNSYEKAINYKIGFNSTIPNKFKLPILKENKSEGIVIRSMTEHFIIKKKIPEFQETTYSDNSVSSKDMKTIAENMITENRLNNAISKVGFINEGNKFIIYNLICEDILKELKIKKLENKEIYKFIVSKIYEKFN